MLSEDMEKGSTSSSSSPSTSCGAEFLLKAVIWFYMIIQGSLANFSGLFLCLFGVVDRKSDSDDEMLLIFFVTTFLWFLVGFIWAVRMLKRCYFAQLDHEGLFVLLFSRRVGVALTAVAATFPMFIENELLIPPSVIILATAVIIDLPTLLMMNAILSRLVPKSKPESQNSRHF